jgi:arylsulfatase A-like enzyme
MRLPNATLAMQVPPPQRPHYALDIVPTVLDALALPATVIEPYYGRSLLREQPSPDERVLFTAEAPGTTTIMLHDGPFRLARLNSGGYFCAADHERDPRQKRPVCFNVDPSTGKRKNTLEDLPAEDKARLEAWVDDRGLRTWNEHLAVNGRYWSAASAPAHERRRAAYLETTRGLLAQSAA